MVVSILDASVILPSCRNSRTACSRSCSEAGVASCCAWANRDAIGVVFSVCRLVSLIRAEGSPQPLSPNPMNSDVVKKRIKRATRFGISVQSTQKY